MPGQSLKLNFNVVSEIKLRYVSFGNILDLKWDYSILYKITFSSTYLTH